MQVKLFEVRDRATFLPVMAVGIKPKKEDYLLRRVGFAEDGFYVILTRLAGETPSSADPYFWGDRTLTVAHDYILNNWQELKDGDVIDVEYILKETEKKKLSEKYHTL